MHIVFGQDENNVHEHVRDEPQYGIDDEEPEEQNNEYNSSWQFAANYAVMPKTAALIQERKRSHSGSMSSVYTYHGNLGILDNHSIFDAELEDWSYRYDLDTGITDKPYGD